MGLFKKWRAKKAAKKQLKAEQKTQEAKAEQEVKEVKKPAEQPKPAATQTPKAEPKVEQKAEQKAETSDDKAAKYHVSQNKDSKSENYKMWRVRKQGSNKTIKFFKTQKEAIEYAEDLAEKAGSSVVIHKMDGKIRKQNYNE